MRQGKYSKNSRKRTAKASAVLIAMLLLGCLAVGGTVAFLMDTDGPLQNLFNPSQVVTEVLEDIKTDNTKKQDVRIQNSGNTDAWIRAAVVVTWQNRDGEIYGKAPVEGEDYDIQWGSEDWLLGADGFYYWKYPVAPNGATGILIESCTQKKHPSGYYLTVEIIGSGIQSKPVRVFNTKWASSGLTANGNSLTTQ